MHTKTVSSRLAIILLGVTLCSSSNARAVNRDMVQLQTQIQQLQDAIARLQQSNDERMGVLKDLVQQSADSVNKMSVTVEGLQRQLQTQAEAQGTKVEQVSGQVQALNDSLDEIKARFNRLEKVMQDIQGQQQSISASMQNGQPAGGSTPPASALAPPPDSSPTPAPVDAAPPSSTIPAGRKGKPSAALPVMPPTAPSTSALPADELYKTALGDYMAAKYPLAASEFADIVKAYPDNPLAGNALYYEGEIEYRNGRYAAAAKSYDRVLEQYPDNNKVPASHLHKAQALIQLKQNDAGIRELRSLIQRFPNSPEATQARSRLNGMGVPVAPRR